MEGRPTNELWRKTTLARLAAKEEKNGVPKNGEGYVHNSEREEDNRDFEKESEPDEKGHEFANKKRRDSHVSP